MLTIQYGISNPGCKYFLDCKVKKHIIVFVLSLAIFKIKRRSECAIHFVSVSTGLILVQRRTTYAYKY